MVSFSYMNNLTTISLKDKLLTLSDYSLSTDDSGVGYDLYRRSKNVIYTRILNGFNKNNVTGLRELIDNVTSNTAGEKIKRNFEVFQRNSRLTAYIAYRRLEDYSDTERMLPLSSAANVYN